MKLSVLAAINGWCEGRQTIQTGVDELHRHFREIFFDSIDSGGKKYINLPTNFHLY